MSSRGRDRFEDEQLSNYRDDVRYSKTIKTRKQLDLLMGNVGKAKIYPKSQIIFRQGDAAGSIFYVNEGVVRLSVSSNNGKEAIVGLLAEGDFFGDGLMVGQAHRMQTATAMTYSHLLQIDKAAMTLLLRQEQRICDLLISRLVAKNIQIEETLIDLLFNSSEKRLARVLLLLCPLVSHGAPKTVIPNVSQRILAEIVGTTRSRVNMFMNKFRSSGFITYGKAGIRVHSSLLKVFLADGHK